MSLRIPLSPDQTLQTEFHEIERRLRRLEKRTGVSAGSTTIQVLGGGVGVTNLQPLITRIEALEAVVAAIPDPDDFDIDVFGAVGPSSATGIVPEPGVAVPPTGVAQHLLTEDAEWGFPLRGLIGVATPGDETEAVDVVDINAGLHAGHVTAGDVTCNSLYISGDVEYMNSFFEDLRFPASGINPAGTPSPPAQDTVDPFAGTLLFDAAGTDVIAGVAQMPHSWRTGTPVTPHIHWAPTSTDTGDVAWRFSYVVAGINDTFAGSLTTAGIEVDAGDGTTNKNQNHDFSDITMTGYGVSATIIWKLERVGGDGSDTYADDARLLEIDFHFEVSTPGERI